MHHLTWLTWSCQIFKYQFYCLSTHVHSYSSSIILVCNPCRVPWKNKREYVKWAFQLYILKNSYYFILNRWQLISHIVTYNQYISFLHYELPSTYSIRCTPHIIVMIITMVAITAQELQNRSIICQEASRAGTKIRCCSTSKWDKMRLKVLCMACYPSIEGVSSSSIFVTGPARMWIVGEH